MMPHLLLPFSLLFFGSKLSLQLCVNLGNQSLLAGGIGLRPFRTTARGQTVTSNGNGTAMGTYEIT